MRRVHIHFIALSGLLLSALPAYASDHAAEGGKKMLPALDVALYPSVLFWMTLSFLALLVVIQFIGVPNIQKTIGNRQETLDRDLESARQKGETAKATVESYEEGLHQARLDAHKTVSDIVAESEKEASSQLESQAREIKERLSVTQEKIAKAKEDALKEATPFIGDLVDEVYNEVLQSGLNPQATGARK